ncbi:hypothetical protein BOTBODRAFT_181131 [Botryobasidium botryosum FD-172 SS1]|uniref:Ring-like domain-containing protein n=1 Tax=Botryobasidium botryosum (strain FD-172 SS1) TaxID=930990 RepID=A0A067LX69_BOTB1|nr:hypothetical protein BOTBODRAFT_181131 [Botryobasidium botryosum FD-172 SS1]
MLEYFAYKKYKQYQADRQRVLDQKDETYFKNLADNETHEIPLDKDGDVSEKAPPGKYDWMLPGFLAKSDGKKDADTKDAAKTAPILGPDGKEMSPAESELHDALDRLNLAAEDGKAFSLSAETKELLDKFSLILKDTVNGVPTAYDDLVKFFETSSPQIEKKYEAAPGFLQKLITTLPLMLLPEELAKSAGVGTATQSKSLKLPTLRQLIEKPTMITTAMKAVMTQLQRRFPAAALGANTLVSMTLFVLLFILWYCHKRGKEVRLEKEAADALAAEAATTASLARAPTVPTGEPGARAAENVDGKGKQREDPIPAPNGAVPSATSKNAPVQNDATHQ